MAERISILELQRKWMRMLSHPGLDFATMMAISQFLADLEQLAKDYPVPTQITLRDVINANGAELERNP